MNTSNNSFRNLNGLSIENDTTKVTYEAAGFPVDFYIDNETGVLVRFDVNVVGQKVERDPERYQAWLKASLAGESFEVTEAGVEYVSAKAHNMGKAVPIAKALSQLTRKYATGHLESSLHLVEFDPAIQGMFAGAVHSNYSGPINVRVPVTEGVWSPLYVAEKGRLQTKRWNDSAFKEMCQVHDIISALSAGRGYSVFFGWIAGRNKFADGKRNFVVTIFDYLKVLNTQGVEAAEELYASKKAAATERRKVYGESKAIKASGAVSIETVVRVAGQEVEIGTISEPGTYDIVRNGAFLKSISVDPTDDGDLATIQAWQNRGCEVVRQ